MRKPLKLWGAMVFFIMVLPAVMILMGQNMDCNCPGGDKAAMCQDVSCGDNTCDTSCGEQINYPDQSGYCPGDCCSQIARCGNGVCESGCGENHTQCPADCLL